MRSLQDEIRQAHKELSCPICGRAFALKDINIRSFITNQTAELSVVCQRGHFPVILLVPITLRELAKAGNISTKEIKKFEKTVDDLTTNLSNLYENNGKKD